MYRIAAIAGGCNPPGLNDLPWFESKCIHKSLKYASVAQSSRAIIGVLWYNRVALVDASEQKIM